MVGAHDLRGGSQALGRVERGYAEWGLLDLILTDAGFNSHGNFLVIAAASETV